MTNKYLTKIAASLQDEKDSAKTFGKAWLAGHAGTYAGAAVGALGVGALAARHKGFGQALERTGQGIGRLRSRLSETGLGKGISKIMGHKSGPAAAGAIVGGLAGGDIGDYAAIRHGIIHSKKNGNLQKQAEHKKKDPIVQGVVAGIGSVGMGQLAVMGAAGQEALKGSFNSKGKYTKTELGSIRSYLRKNNLRNVKFEKDFTKAGPHFRLDDGPKVHQTSGVRHDSNWQHLKSKYKRPIVNNPFKSFDTTMHELGHAKDYANKGSLRTKIQMGTQMTSRLGALPIGAALGATALKNKKTEKYAPLIAALPAVPVLHSEFSANHNAFKHIKKTMGRRRALGYAASHVLPMTSYAVTHGAPAIGTYFAGRAMKKNRVHND